MEVFGYLDSQIKVLVNKLNESDAIGSIRHLNEEETGRRRGITYSLWKVKRQKK